METHQVRYFLALASTLNFTRAAELSNVTQPALTKAIQKLEWEFGGALVHRERRNTQLTELGQQVLPLLRQAMRCEEAAREMAQDLGRQRFAPLRIGLSPTVSAALLAEPLAELARSLPGLQVDLLGIGHDRVCDSLIQGEIHAGFGGLTARSSARIDEWPLFEERYVVVVRADDPLAAAPEILLESARQATWLERVGCEVAGAFRDRCFDPGEVPRIAHRAAQEDHLQQMALAGLGAYLAPEHAVAPAGLVARPLVGNPLRRAVGLRVVAGRRYTPPMDAFLRLARRWSWPANPGIPVAPLSRGAPSLRIVR